jgi:hypothetical protein
MRFSVEAWATEYGSPMEVDDRERSDTKVDVGVERPASKWQPLSPTDATEVPETILFTDGVRRIDARVWIDTDEGRARPGVCASYAAGVMRCDGRAELAGWKVERGLFSAVADVAPIHCRHASYEVRRSEGDAPEDLWLAIQKRMAELESALASDEGTDLVVVDGPLRGDLQSGSRVGYIKTHHVGYLPPEVEGVVGALAPGQRTPLFLTLGRWGRFCWYTRLPGGAGHSWAGVVRCETSADVDKDGAVRLAEVVTRALPRFASVGHKDPRAPQNLYPIAGLERELRRRLGDPALLYRDLRVAAGPASSS